MKTIITNDQGKLEEITIAEDKSAWVYAGLCFAMVALVTLVALVGVGSWLFYMG